ncbi:MAG: hypothetical protein CTY22_07500, partial [Methylomonas sp.]
MNSKPSASDARIDWQDDGVACLVIEGEWLKHSRIERSERILTQLRDTPCSRLVVQTEGLTDWDSRLPSFLLHVIRECGKRDIPCDFQQIPAGAHDLLQLALAVPERAGARRSGKSPAFFHGFSRYVFGLVNDGRHLVVFIGELVLALATLLCGRARFRGVDLAIFIQDAGPGGFVIVSIISLLVGLILAFVGALQLAMFGAQIYIADLVALGTVREMGPLMTAIIMSGRTGAAYAAQLGTMTVNSEIDALRTMGISPMEFLVLPRTLALVLMMPLLTLYACLMGIVGGGLVSNLAFNITLIQYYNQIIKAVDLYDV